MSTEEKIVIIEEIMDLDEGTLSESSVLADFDEWDSLSKLSLIATAKKQFNLVLKTETIKNFVTVADICNFLQ